MFLGVSGCFLGVLQRVYMDIRDWPDAKGRFTFENKILVVLL